MPWQTQNSSSPLGLTLIEREIVSPTEITPSESISAYTTETTLTPLDNPFAGFHGILAQVSLRDHCHSTAFGFPRRQCHGSAHYDLAANPVVLVRGVHDDVRAEPANVYDRLGQEFR